MERKGRVWFWRVWAFKQKMKLFFESHLSRIGISRFQGTAAVSEPVASPLSTDVPDAIKDYTMLRRKIVASCMILHWVWMSLPQAAEYPREINHLSPRVGRLPLPWVYASSGNGRPMTSTLTNSGSSSR